MSKQKNKTKKEEFPQWCYDGLVDFVLRLENDLGALDEIRLLLERFTSMWAASHVDDKCFLRTIWKDILPSLAELSDRLLQSAEALPHANAIYYDRQDPRPGENYGEDERPPLILVERKEGAPSEQG